jgi:hypothetical protein
VLSQFGSTRGTPLVIEDDFAGEMRSLVMARSLDDEFIVQVARRRNVYQYLLREQKQHAWQHRSARTLVWVFIPQGIVGKHGGVSFSLVGAKYIFVYAR